MPALLFLLLIISAPAWATSGGDWNAYVIAGEKAYQRGDYAQAEKQWLVALRVADGFGSEDGRLSQTLDKVTALYQAQGRYAEAEPFYERLLRIDEEAVGPIHPNVARDLDNLAALYQVRRKYTEAASAFKRSVVIWQKVLWPKHPHVATTLDKLARVYESEGNYTEAEAVYRRALAMREEVLGSSHPVIAESFASLARLYRVQGKTAKGALFYQRAVAILDKALAFGKNPRHAADTLERYASLLREMNRPEEAATMEGRAKVIRTRQR